jgi:Protein of unknown function (DUF1573)
MVAALFSALVLATPPEPLKFDAPSLDAGEVKAGPALVRRFAFVNAGAAPLSVTDLKASCGCATPTLTQRTYQPGERGELALEVNTLSQPAGPQRWTLTVGYRCGDRAGAVTLELTAKLVKVIDVSPVALQFHGCGQEHEISVSARSPEHARSLHVVGVRTSSSKLRVKGPDGGSDAFAAPGQTLVSSAWHVRVSVADDCPEGTHSEAVWLRTDDPDYAELKVPVTIIREAKRQTTAAPSKVTLVAGGSALVQLRDADGRPVKVEAAEASHKALTCRWAAGPGALATLRVGLDRGQWDGGELTGEVRVRANGQALVIPVAVRARE